MDSIALNMVYSKSTKNKHVLVEVGGGEAIQGLYISRDTFEGETEVSLQGKKFKLVIEEVED